MTILIRLKDTLWVAASEIASVSMDRNGQVIVKMKDGACNLAENDYGVSGSTTMERLILKINHAEVTENGFKPS
jgi:hypothetical protein